jgi:hypothetical protein
LLASLAGGKIDIEASARWRVERGCEPAEIAPCAPKPRMHDGQRVVDFVGPSGPMTTLRTFSGPIRSGRSRSMYEASHTAKRAVDRLSIY